MKSALILSAVALLVYWTTALNAQVAVETVPNPVAPAANAQTPVPAAPVLPTPGGERRAIRREERRIDRNDPNGTLAPTVQFDGRVTATPNYSPSSPTATAPGTPMPASPEQWRYRQQNGQWWYYTPASTWLVWNGNSWGAYGPSAGISAPAAPSNGGYTTYYRAPNQPYYGRPYRRGFLGGRYYY